ncbi:MAG: hypothetical protein RID11_02445 [Roseovarius sp.]|uniref:hypothetical protein n=1 Tax=Roseovarius sp. TaxID=1486281 RepID=UPI0032EFAFCF
MSIGGRWPTLLGMPIAGLLWSLATLLGNHEQVAALGVSQTEALVFVSLGGTAQTAAIWVGFSIIVWAMIRAFGARASMARVSALVSAEALPFWFGAPALAYSLNCGLPGAKIATLAATVSLALFLYGLTRGLVTEMSWTVIRASGAVAASFIFIASFAYLAV